MRSFFDAIRPRAARSFVCAAAFLVTWGTGLSAAHADDNSAWFGETYKGTSLGLSAGVMRLGAGSRAEETTEGTTARRGQRGTQVASLGRGYSVSTESGEEEAVARPRSTRRTRTASLGYNAPIASSRRGKEAAKRRTPRNVRVASIGGVYAPKPSLGPSLSGGSVRWAATSGCLNSGLRSVVASLAASYGPVTVNSTCRSRRHNARVGGARRSHHLTGNAVDFRVRGNWRGAIAYLRSSGTVGGLNHYGGGRFHIDTGARRSW